MPFRRTNAIKVLLSLFTLILLFGHSTRSDSITPIAANTTLTLRLDGQAAAVLVYDASEAETVTVTVKAIDDLDPVVELVNPAGQRLAYNDDYGGKADLLPEAAPALAPTDAALVGIALPAAGRYLIRVNSFNGVSTGEVEVTLSMVDPFYTVIDRQDDRTTLQVTLTPDSIYRYTFPVVKGQAYTLIARDPRGVLDAVLTVRDASGEVVIDNDDHIDGDLTLNIFDARITDFTAPADGDYTLELREFAGRAGTFEITLQS